MVFYFRTWWQTDMNASWNLIMASSMLPITWSTKWLSHYNTKFAILSSNFNQPFYNPSGFNSVVCNATVRFRTCNSKKSNHAEMQKCLGRHLPVKKPRANQGAALDWQPDHIPLDLLTIFRDCKHFNQHCCRWLPKRKIIPHIISKLNINLILFNLNFWHKCNQHLLCRY